MPRSGTTLLGHLLSAHPDVSYLEEPRTLWRIGNEGRSDVLHAADARPDVVQKVRAAFDKTITQHGGRRMLEKTPSNALRLDYMKAIYPEGIFLHVVRNGYNATLSIRSLTQQHSTGIPRNRILVRLKQVKPQQIPYYAKEVLARTLPKSLRGKIATPMWGPRLPGMAKMVQELGPLAVACLQWRACVEAACQAGRKFPKDQYLEFKLEDLSREVLDGVLDFCHLSRAPEVYEEWERRFRPEDPAARAKVADPQDLETIRQWIEPTMEWLGYPAETPAPEVSP